MPSIAPSKNHQWAQQQSSPQQDQPAVAVKDRLVVTATAAGVGGTNVGRLTSFSLVDILSYGRVCTIMNRIDGLPTAVGWATVSVLWRY